MSRFFVMLALAVGFAAGWGIGRGWKSPARELAPPASVVAPAAMEEKWVGSRSVTFVGSTPTGIEDLLAELSQIDELGFGSIDSLARMAELGEMIRNSDPAALAARMVASGNYSESSWGLVMTAFAEKDPTAAWNFAVGMNDVATKNLALMSVLMGISTSDPDRAMALVKTLDPQYRVQTRSMVLMMIARRDPQKALDLAAFSSDGAGDYSIQAIFHQWARKDPEAAKAAAARMQGNDGAQARMALLNGLVQRDPKAAWEYALTIGDPSGTHQDPRLQVIMMWGSKDPAAALDAAGQITDANIRTQAIASAVGQWSRNDLSAAIEYAKGVEDTVLRSDILRNMAVSATGDRGALLDAVIESMPVGDNFQQAVSTLMSGWARENPAEAAAASSRLPAGKIYSQAVQDIASQWAQSGNKDEAFAWARALPEGESRNGAVGSVLSQWSSQDPTRALAVLNSLPSDEKSQAMFSVASGWSRKDPQAVLKWSTSIGEDNVRQSVIQSAVSQWASSEPEAAAQYAGQLSESDRPRAISSVMNRWAAKDTEAAAQWLSDQPAGAWKDPSIVTLSRKVAGEDPATALNWASAISDPKQRARQTESLARDWMRQDAGAAKAWIKNSKLPADTKKRLME